VQVEVEARFLGQDHPALRSLLLDAGGVCHAPMRLMRRKVYDFPDRSLDMREAWVRVRDEGGQVTMSYKQQDDPRSVRGTREVCVTVDSFEKADQLLRAVGLVQKVYHETKRETWHVGDVQVELEEWPWVRPYIEIEGPDETAVRRAAKILGLDWSQAVFGSTDVYRAEYDVTDHEVNHWKEILFCPVPAWLAAKRLP